MKIILFGESQLNTRMVIHWFVAMKRDLIPPHINGNKLIHSLFLWNLGYQRPPWQARETRIKRTISKLRFFFRLKRRKSESASEHRIRRS